MPTPNIISYVVDVGANHLQAKPVFMTPRAPSQPHTEALTVRLVDVVLWANAEVWPIYGAYMKAVIIVFIVSAWHLQLTSWALAS